MNSVILSGRLTKKPELRSTQSGVSVCQFSLAVNRDKDKTDFIECICFNKTAENLCRYKDKGEMIELTGRMENNSYTDKEGKKHYKTIVSVNLINYINSGQTSVYEAKNEQKDPYLEMGNRINDEYDLPF